jgi:hypothetical protein
MKLLLMVTTVLEAVVGLGLFVFPAALVPVLLGAPVDTPAGMAVSRLAGAAIIAIAICCWQARNSEHSGAGLGVVTALLFYNVAAAAVLVYAGVRLGLQSPYIWPTIVMHSAMALWCAAVVWFAMRKQQASAADGE